MEKIFTRVEDLAGTIKSYINNRIESAKIKIAEKSSTLIANLMAGIIVIMVLFFCMLFAGIALAILLGNWMENTWLGFLAVAGIYLFIGFIVWFGRDRLIRRPAMNNMIHQLFDENDQ